MVEQVQVIGINEAEIKLANEWAEGDNKKWLPATIGFCQYVAPRVTGAGQTAWHTALTIAAFALLIWSLYEQIKIFMMRYGIAKEYANLATSQWHRFIQRYKPLENAMVQEALAKSWAPVDYEGARIRMDGFADWAWGAAAKDRELLAKRYRICPDRTVAWNAFKGLGSDDMVNFGYREAEAHAKALNDLWWNQRSELLNIGRGHAAIGTRFAAVADDLLRPIGEGARALTSGMFQTIGYMYYRNMLTFGSIFTQTPTVSERIAGGGATTPDPGPAASPGSGSPI